MIFKVISVSLVVCLASAQNFNLVQNDFQQLASPASFQLLQQRNVQQGPAAEQISANFHQSLLNQRSQFPQQSPQLTQQQLQNAQPANTFPRHDNLAVLETIDDNDDNNQFIEIAQIIPSPAIRTPTPAVIRSKKLRTNNVATLAAITNTAANADADLDEEKLFHEQAKNAKYSFDSDVQDTINDHAITRQETRDGLALKGMYSYSDGFFKRTVHYEADEGGYRVTKEDIQPIGDGPRINPQGKADVSSSLIGKYSITADDIRQDPKESQKIGKQSANKLVNV